MKDYNEAVGAQLRAERIRKKITAQDVAYRIGVDRSTVTHWETNRRTISAEQFFLYCEVLNVNPESMVRRVKAYYEKIEERKVHNGDDNQ